MRCGSSGKPFWAANAWLMRGSMVIGIRKSPILLFGPKGAQPFDRLTAVPAAIRANQLGWGLLGLVVSHGLSFYSNYLKSGEYERASLNALMSQPYSRVMVLHMTVLLGGWPSCCWARPSSR